MNITQLRIGNVTVDSIIERDGPWRTPADLFPDYDPETARAHFAEMDNFGFDPQSGRTVITYQTFVLRTPHHTILVDTCTGEDKNYPAPMNFPKQPWLDGFASLGLGFEDIDYVFCTHLHIDHCGWNTRLVGGRWVADLPKGAIHLSQTCREPDWSTIFCWDQGCSGCRGSRPFPLRRHDVGKRHRHRGIGATVLNASDPALGLPAIRATIVQR
jgi:Metallo-beta-lactamase superfamily